MKDIHFTEKFKYNGGKMKRLIGLMLVLIAIASVAAAQSITVLSPNGGENWLLGTKKPIKWSAPGIKVLLKIKLRKGDQFVGLIKDGQDPKSGFLDWEVGKLMGGKTVAPGSGYKIVIKAEGTTITDDSNTPFTISDKLSIKNPGHLKALASLTKISVSQPDHNSKWKEGETKTILWVTALKPPFKVELYNYNGTKKIRDCIGLSKSEGGLKYSLLWKIPTDVYKWPGNYTIKVSQNNISGLSKMFHISKALNIKSYTFSATTVNKLKWHSYKPDKDVFTAEVNPTAADPGPGKMRVGYENHYSSDYYKGFIYRSWVFFNLGNLKGLVTKATLSFNHFMGCNFTPKVYVLNQKWNMDPITLFNIPCSMIDPSSNLGLIVNEWIAKNNNYGLVFVGTDESFKHNSSQCVGFFENVKLTIEIIEDVK
jgi:hypothetical protein